MARTSAPATHCSAASSNGPAIGAGHRGDAGERHGSEEQRGRDAQREPALVSVRRAVDEHVAGQR